MYHRWIFVISHQKLPHCTCVTRVTHDMIQVRLTLKCRDMSATPYSDGTKALTGAFVTWCWTDKLKVTRPEWQTQHLSSSQTLLLWERTCLQLALAPKGKLLSVLFWCTQHITILHFRLTSGLRSKQVITSVYTLPCECALTFYCTNCITSSALEVLTTLI